MKKPPFTRGVNIAMCKKLYSHMISLLLCIVIYFLITNENHLIKVVTSPKDNNKIITIMHLAASLSYIPILLGDG